jgi:hypothetical protein
MLRPRRFVDKSDTPVLHTPDLRATEGVGVSTEDSGDLAN